MSDIEAVHVVPVKSVRSVEVIDGGDTVAVRMKTAGGHETCVLLPMAAVGDLLFFLGGALGAKHD